MRTYTIKDKEHYVYDLRSELPDGLVIAPDWKKSRRGDWVMADDGAYVQVLDVKKIGHTTAVLTCTGTYSINKKMDTAERESRYTLNGKHGRTQILRRKNPTQRETLFAKRCALGEKPVDAYLAVYNANSRSYASKRAALLLKTQRVRNLMTKDMKDVFDKLGATTHTMVEVVWNVAQHGKNDSDKLKAASMMWDAADLVEKTKVTEIAGIFQGFDQKKLEEVQRPELPDHQATGDETI